MPLVGFPSASSTFCINFIFICTHLYLLLLCSGGHMTLVMSETITLLASGTKQSDERTWTGRPTRTEGRKEKGGNGKKGKPVGRWVEWWEKEKWKRYLALPLNVWFTAECSLNGLIFLCSLWALGGRLPHPPVSQGSYEDNVYKRFCALSCKCLHRGPVPWILVVRIVLWPQGS